MKRILIFITTLIFTVSTGNISAQNKPNFRKCYTIESMKNDFKEHPELESKYNQFQTKLKEYTDQNLGSQRAAKRIIPVVFHVVHEGGSENISKAQILDQIQRLNKDYALTNGDFSQVPSCHAAVAANCEVEFRLATKDPQGNCTDGIVRVYSSKTNNASNQSGIKTVSHWDSFRYLNVWVVKSIGALDGVGGEVLGYAQFPAGGLLSTDGLVIRHDCIGSIGTAAGGAFGPRLGRTMTHEAGHWLGLRHIWGDADCGSDGVEDTPSAYGPNYGICYSDFPYIPLIVSGGDTATCNTNYDCGEMFENYMDYSDDACMAMFTQGQKAVMNGVFANFRSYMVSEENLAFTGVRDEDIANPITCAPMAESAITTACTGSFNSCTTPNMVCAGGSIRFDESIYNTTNFTQQWSFEGGTPSSSSAPTPLINYSTPGIYDYSLTASNSAGSNSINYDNKIRVYANAAEQQPNDGSFYWEDYNEPQDFASWIVFNPDNRINKWEWAEFKAYGGTSGLRMRNYNNVDNEADRIVSPAYTLVGIPSPAMSFRVAAAERGGEPADMLSVYYSINCGQNWKLIKSWSGSNLITSGLFTSEFVPSSTNQFENFAASLSLAANKENVRIMFEFKAGAEGSNNLYIDDLRIGTSLGVNDVAESISLNIYPNPTQGLTNLSFTLDKPSSLSIQVFDMLGKLALAPFASKVSDGNQNISVDMSQLSKGMYTLRLEVDGKVVNRKISHN
jgi:PKD repeat protein